MRNSNSQALLDMKAAVGRIGAYAASDNQKNLSMAEDAVERNLVILYEASKRISPHLRHGHLWARLAKIGERLEFQYYEVTSAEVWAIVDQDLPDCATVIDDLIAKVERDQKNG